MKLRVKVPVIAPAIEFDYEITDNPDFEEVSKALELELLEHLRINRRLMFGSIQVSIPQDGE